MTTDLKRQITLIDETGGCLDRLQPLATRLQLPVLQPGAVTEETPFQLVITDRHLELRETGPGAPGPVHIDFVDGRSAHRRHFGGGRGQPLARAVGLKKGQTPWVLDATAGLGRDAFVLATLGCRVTLVERSPVIHALLEDALRRARQDPEVGSIAERMELVNADSQEYLHSLSASGRPEVIYLDPMYPHRDKSALVKKEMRIFRTLVGDDLDSGRLLQQALQSALRRVVVKRPMRAGFVADMKPDAQIKGPTTRYDLYFHHT